MKKVNQFKNEIKWVNIFKNGVKYLVTSDRQRTIYYIYKQVDDDYIKLGKGKNPIELEDKYVK